MTDFSAYITTKDDPQAVRCSGEGGRNSYYYRVPQGSSVIELVSWFRDCCEAETGERHYPHKVADREYEFVTDLGPMPTELIEALDAAESDYEILRAECEIYKWYKKREIELFEGVDNA